MSKNMKRKREQNNVVSHSHMPDDVVETIFSHLPIKEAHRVSILSQRFRHSWKFCRDLSFDRNFAGNMSNDEFKKAVNKFFHHHRNTAADRFRLYFDAADDINLVSYWMQKAVHLGIKEIELDLTPSKKKFSLSFDLVDVKTIKTMKLVNCELDLPLNSNGLRHLTELTLQNVRARPVLVKAVFGNCFSLTTFRLVRCNCIYNLRICCGPDLRGFKTLVVENCSEYDSVAIVNAPSLSCLRYRGKICEFQFQCELEKLNDVVLEIENPKDFRMLPRRKEMVIGLAYVRSLAVTTTFLEGLSGKIEEMEFNFWKLTKFQLIVTSDSYINPSDIAIFLKKCPRVDTISIDIGHNAFGDSTYWNMKGRNILSEWKTPFPMLKHVKLEGFTLKEQPVTMARFFLKNAIYLNSLVIVKAKNFNFPQNFTPDCLVSGILSNANIEILDFNRDATATVRRSAEH